MSYLEMFSTPIKPLERPIVGRDFEMRQIRAAFERPELCNVMLLGNPGSGKTTIVQGIASKDTKRDYLEVDLAKMIAGLNDPNEMAAKLKGLFNEAEERAKTKEVVLFIDEFHQIVKLSLAAVEALKPMLADSGTRGLRIVAATTFSEFREHVSSNQPLVERFQRITLAEPDEDTVVAILKGMAKRYGVENEFNDDSIFRSIYELTNQYIPANSQPRKSILMLDNMIGWYKAYKDDENENIKLDKKLLSQVIKDTEGVNTTFKVDASLIKKTLDKRVLNQNIATKIIEDTLQICIADMHDKSKPVSSFLFTGATGTGKMVANYEDVPVINKETGVLEIVKHENLEVGTKVVTRKGEESDVLGLFPHKNVQMYKVTLSDGRSVDVGAEHLWAVYSRYGMKKRYDNQEKLAIMSTKYMFESGIRTGSSSFKQHKYAIPLNKPVVSKDRNYGDINDQLDLIAMYAYNYKSTNESNGDLIQAFKNFTHPKLRPSKSPIFVMRLNANLKGSYLDFTNGLHQDLKLGSIMQRETIVKAIFDNYAKVNKYKLLQVTVNFKSNKLANDIKYILHSLGHYVVLKGNVLHVRGSIDKLKTLFYSEIKLNELDDLDKRRADSKKSKDYNMVQITNIEPIGVDNAQCIYISDPEHLYLVNDFIVTHNTEITKQLAGLLFDDDRALIRFDMTEYSDPRLVTSFKNQLTTAIWERPYSILLLDEIEKADGNITRLLLQVLDDARLTDQNGRVVPFNNCYIIATTNAGADIYDELAKLDTGEVDMDKQIEKLKELIKSSIMKTTGKGKFPPELVGRFDAIVPFKPLNEETLYKILEIHMEKLTKEVKEKHNVNLSWQGASEEDRENSPHIKTKVQKYVVEEKGKSHDTSSGGARNIISIFKSDVKSKLAKFINEYPDIKNITVGVEGAMRSENKEILESQARIIVGEREYK